MPSTASRQTKPASATVRAQMQSQRERDTRIERQLRSELHRLGLRFRLHRRVLPGSRREADIVFPGPRVAVFVDGCFWHGCPDHATWPQNNATFWKAKIESNARRDKETSGLLEELGWAVRRVWGHESASVAARRIARVVRTRSRVP